MLSTGLFLPSMKLLLPSTPLPISILFYSFIYVQGNREMGLARNGMWTATFLLLAFSKWGPEVMGDCAVEL